MADPGQEGGGRSLPSEDIAVRLPLQEGPTGSPCRLHPVSFLWLSTQAGLGWVLLGTRLTPSAALPCPPCSSLPSPRLLHPILLPGEDGGTPGR